MRPWRLFMSLLIISPAFSAEVTPPSPETLKLVKTIDLNEEGKHATGRAGSRGWELDYRRDRPGYAVAGFKEPLLLEPGFYRATFVLRRGTYPKKGLLFKSYGLFRIEMWDATDNTPITLRELQIGDFDAPNRYERKWVEFSMEGREGHAVEARVYWVGLANGEIEKIDIERFADASPENLAKKADVFSHQLAANHLENGFVVSRKPDGSPDELGDATTYTGFYVTSLAWKYDATRDDVTYQALENGIATLHRAIKGTDEDPILVRYVDKDGEGFPKSPSKDVYTSFFLAYAAAYPLITNPALKDQMKSDIERIGTKFLKDGLRVKSGQTALVDLTPYLTQDEINEGIQKLMQDGRKLKKFTKSLKMSQRYVPFGEIWPGTKAVIRALEKHDENRLLELVIPTMNGSFLILERVRDILREQYRQDLFPRRYTNQDYPGAKLAELIHSNVRRFPKKESGQRIQQLSDLKILASNALIALHIIKTAAVITKKPQFIEYYQTNLYTQDALLKTALDWYGMEDRLTQLTAGNAAADQERRGYLGLLSLCNLASLEENPSIKESYISLLEREWDHYRRDDNPMVTAFVWNLTKQRKGTREEIARALNLYPENRVGFGADHWAKHGREVAEKLGGGEKDGYSREALPVSARPKDSFLWQRNPRRLNGDDVKSYPATDYLFVYWYARKNKIIPEPKREATVQR